MPHTCTTSCYPLLAFFFFFKATATTAIYTLSLHDALPIYDLVRVDSLVGLLAEEGLHDLLHLRHPGLAAHQDHLVRSEEHTSELQSHSDLVCRLLLEKKKKKLLV